jgi:hypothetical protein
MMGDISRQSRWGEIMSNRRVKVTIRCNRCGEKFTLRGRKERGRIDTGFKMCLCNNAADFLIEEEA